MAVTTQAQEYKRLRSYLNPYLRGANVDAVLNALASGSSSYLINNAAAVNDQLYVTTASGVYLDQLLSAYGIQRPSNVGLSDDIFSQIGIEVKNRKQVRDLLNNILNIMFGNELTKASNDSTAYEPYNLADGDTLTINFDESETITITFSTAQFQDIAAAKAIEVADAITETLRSRGLTGTATTNNDGNGTYVELLSDTIGPASSVTVLGGSAQNQLKFPSILPAGGNPSTQWTVSLQPGGIVRFTWSGGANPLIGAVSVGNYVNIYGGGFLNSGYEGNYTIINAVGGAVNESYFDVENPLAPTPGGGFNPVTQGGTIQNPTILFFAPTRETLASLHSYAAIYQTQGRVLQIFLPAATKVVRRSRIGAAHLHYPPTEVFSFSANPNNGDHFSITTTTTLVAGTDFTISANYQVTMANMVAAIDAISGLVAVVGVDPVSKKNIVTVFQDSPSLTLTGTYSGSASITASGLIGDPISVQPNQQGPYSYDLTQPFTVSATGTTLTEELDGTKSRVFTVANSSSFPDAQGYLIFDYGYENQEGPVPYIGRPSNNTLLISPAYTIKNPHGIGSNVSLIASKGPATISEDGLDYPFYITDVVAGRIYCQQLIESVAATGINVVFTILYPDDIGLGKWGTQYTENPIIWGE